MKIFRAFLLLLTLSLPLAAQTPPQLTNRLNEMKKLDYMVGVWRGTGWIEHQGGRQTFAGTETVQSKLNGLALLVEGKFKGKQPGKDEEVVIHETLAIINYDEKTKAYRFNTYLATGLTGEHELKLLEGGWQWGFQIPGGGNVRYTFKLTDKGEWFEIGEFSQDGKSWRKFFEMTLQKMK
jgi:hypothetical protein